MKSTTLAKFLGAGVLLALSIPASAAPVVGDVGISNVFSSGLFNDNGTIYTPTEAAAGTFATPPAADPPEPAAMAVVGSALIGVGLVGRKRLSR